MKRQSKWTLQLHCRQISKSFSRSKPAQPALLAAISVVLLFLLFDYTFSATAVPSVDSTVAEYRDLSYAGADAPAGQRLDLFVPKSTTKQPLIVFIHGGGWQQGDKVHCPAHWLLAKKYAIASINYRLTDQGKFMFPTQIHDCKAAIRWLRANASKYDYDGDRIGVWGTSAGGHLAALLGTTSGTDTLSGDTKSTTLKRKSAKITRTGKAPDRVEAVVDWYGPTDLLAFDESRLGSMAIQAITGLIGGLPSAHRSLAAAASPISYVSKDDPPFLIMHGDQDPIVPLSQSKELYEKLNKAGVDARLIVIPSGGHGMFAQSYLDEVQKFFDRTLGQKRS